MKFGCNVRASFSNVKMFFQAQTNYEKRTVSGVIPVIDFALNGRFDLGIEVALNVNATGIKEHLQRFDDKYIRYY